LVVETGNIDVLTILILRSDGHGHALASSDGV
jgi:hypothetical protein